VKGEESSELVVASNSRHDTWREDFLCELDELEAGIGSEWPADCEFVAHVYVGRW
jgi:hypothetical protein